MKKVFFSAAFLCAFAFAGKSQAQLNQRLPMNEAAPAKAEVNDDGTLKTQPAQTETKTTTEPKKDATIAPKKEAATEPKKKEKVAKPH